MTEAKERVFHSMEEIYREFFPGSCPSCGEDGDNSRRDFEQVTNPNARICLKCGSPFIRPEETS